MKLQEEMLIVSQKEVAEDIFELVLQGDLVDDMEMAGQFLQLKVPSQKLLLRRPISISSWNKQEKRVHYSIVEVIKPREPTFCQKWLQDNQWIFLVL